MPARIDVRRDLPLGDRLVVHSSLREARVGVVFEDDGETGYLYALSLAEDDPHILDSLHVYNVAWLREDEEPHEVAIAWSEAGTAAALLIDDEPLAMVDFDRRTACCVSGYPPADGRFTASHDWDEVLELRFR